MGRLPTPGGDDGTWGAVLNDFLSVAHNPDGTIRTSALRAVSQLVTFTEAGILVAQPGLTRFRFPFAATITGITAAINTAPTGQAVIVDANKNGSTIFTTQANRPSIAAGANATTGTAVPDITAFSAGDYLTVDIDQIGSSVAGSDLTVIIQYDQV